MFDCLFSYKFTKLHKLEQHHMHPLNPHTARLPAPFPPLHAPTRPYLQPSYALEYTAPATAATCADR
jgi:hypothetical protein